MVLSGPGQPGGLQVINPLDYAPCGLNTLYAVNAIRGAGLSYEELRQALGPADASNAHSMADVVRAAEQVGMIAARAEVDVPIQLSVVRGPQSAQLSVDSNDPDGAKTIGLRWFGQSPAEVRPKAVYSGGEPSHREFVRELVAPYVDGPGAKPPKLVETACGSGRVSVEVVGHRPAGLPASYGVTTVRRVGECVLRVRVRPPDGPTDFHDTVALTFQVGDASHRVDVPIRVRFSGSSLVADAGEVVFAAGRPAELLGQERTVEVRSWFGPPRCESVPTWLTWRVESCGEERYRMHFTVAAPPPGAEPQQQALIVTSGRPSDAPIGMTVRWYAGAPTRNSDVVPP
jgi:hypothetical protein